MMELAAFCLAVAALAVALFALVAALDAREFWRALLDDYRGAGLRRKPGDQAPAPHWSEYPRVR